jgi:WhiB family redox-sensing transcriptional regulator
VISTDWQLRALCRTSDDPDLWFPPGYREPHTAQVRQARAICAGCPVQDICLRQAMALEGDKSAHDRAGIWGGATPRMREDLHKALTERAEARLAA